MDPESNDQEFMHILKKKEGRCFFAPFFALIGMCPNCARQGQIFPNISKRNQKLVEKVE